MTTPTWPLPEVIPSANGFTTQRQSNVIRKQMDVGEPKSRRRATRRLVVSRGTWVLTDYQKLIFEDWYTQEIQDGSLNFNWPDPVDQEGLWLTWFQSDPVIQRLAPDVWNVSFSLISRL